MNEKIALKAENISKQYRLGEVGTGTLSHDLNRFWAKIRGKDDPFLKIGESNDRTQKGDSDYVWALKDIDFEIEQGSAVGIIGRNGAGKSTLLKLLSKVTKPTTGKIYTNGRIASLLEVGTGFHPEMTGKENIFLNGAILGMTRKEIKRKFDEIVDFAGVERYIETPVKRYSSGMYVRLAFAVAAHLESEILIVDEVLAVGDAEFQKKCLGKMNDVSKGEGRTVLFVSHNMAAVKQLCNYGIVMKNGTIEFTGNVQESIEIYLNQNLQLSNDLINDVSDYPRNKSKSGQKAIKKVWMEDAEGNAVNTVLMGQKVSFCFEYEMDDAKNNVNFGVSICDRFVNRVFILNNEIYKGQNYNNCKKGIIKFNVDELLLLGGNYLVDVSIMISGYEWVDFIENAYSFSVESYDVFNSGKKFSENHGVFYSPTCNISIN